MSKENFLSGMATTYSDGNLNRSQTVDLGRSILIIGTATRGPVNQPIKVEDDTDAYRIFGLPSNDSAEETLITAFVEIYNANGGQKDIRLCRISNGTVAKIEIPEESGTGIYTPSEGKYALTIEALYPGDIYNSISITRNIVDGVSCITIFNPITQEEVNFPFNIKSTSGEVIRNVEDLALRINLSSKLNNIIKATATKLSLETVITLDNDDITSGAVTVGEGVTRIDMVQLFTEEEDSGNPGYTQAGKIAPSGSPLTASNNIVEIYEAWQNVNIEKDLDVAGKAIGDLENPVQLDGDGVSYPLLKADGTVDSSGDGEIVQVVVSSAIGTSDGVIADYEFTAYEEINAATLVVKGMTIAGQIIDISSSTYSMVTSGGSLNDNIATIHFNAQSVPSEGMTILVSYDSVPYSVTQYPSLASCKAANSYKAYFLAGDRIYFGSENATDIKINYKARKLFANEVGIIIYNSKSGIIQINEALDLTDGVEIAFSWRYLPEWIDISTVSYALRNGTNGSAFDNATKFKLLAETYTILSDYNFGILTLPKTYVDDTKVVYSEVNGLPIEINAGFLKQMSDYLKGLDIGVGDTIGIMDVKPVQNMDFDTWIDKLLYTDVTDTSRAANIIATKNYMNTIICAANIMCMNDVKTSAYIGSTANILAGIIAKLPINEGLVNKTIDNAMARQQLKKIPSETTKLLADAGYTVIKTEPNGVMKIADCKTAASNGSDYIRATTMLIAKYCSKVVREAIDPFIGQLFDNKKMEAMRTAIQTKLYKVKEAGAIKDFNFDILQTAAERANNNAHVPLVIYPEFELLKVTTTVSMSNATSEE